MSDGIPYIDFLPDNSAEALSSVPALSTRCRDCAFTEGTDADLSPTTSRIRDECVAARCAFYCHKTSDGVTATHLCAGWVAAIRGQP